MPALLSTEKFLSRALTVHGDLFSYSETEYVNSQTKVKIGCRVHGVFQISPGNFLQGHGCPKCGVERRASRLRLTTDVFINKATQTHASQYRYELTSYYNSSTKVVITCPTHGNFEQLPMDHIAGRGCPACGGSQKSNNQMFIDKAVTVHGRQFDYSKTNYVRAKTKVEIVCATHGPFWLTPNGHLLGVGCPSCGVIRSKKTKIAKGMISANPRSLDVYRRRVRHLSLKTYEKHQLLINPEGFPRGFSYHLDHKLSIVDAFNAGISEEVASHRHNLRIIPASQNRSKSSKSILTPEELVSLVKP